MIVGVNTSAVAPVPAGPLLPRPHASITPDPPPAMARVWSPPHAICSHRTPASSSACTGVGLERLSTSP